MGNYGDDRSCKVTGVRKRYVSAGVLADSLGVTARTVERWAEDGLIPFEFRTPGGHYRFDEDKVLQHLRDQRQRDE